MLDDRETVSLASANTSTAEGVMDLMLARKNDMDVMMSTNKCGPLKPIPLIRVAAQLSIALDAAMAARLFRHYSEPDSPDEAIMDLVITCKSRLDSLINDMAPGAVHLKSLVKTCAQLSTALDAAMAMNLFYLAKAS
jgi:hypothetical protein